MHSDVDVNRPKRPAKSEKTRAKPDSQTDQGDQDTNGNVNTQPTPFVQTTSRLTYNISAKYSRTPGTLYKHIH